MKTTILLVEAILISIAVYACGGGPVIGLPITSTGSSFISKAKPAKACPPAGSEQNFARVTNVGSAEDVFGCRVTVKAKFVSTKVLGQSQTVVPYIDATGFTSFSASSGSTEEAVPAYIKKGADSAVFESKAGDMLELIGFPDVFEMGGKPYVVFLAKSAKKL